ncbi:TerD family protein, partial [Streptomyces sp. HYC2]
MTAELVRGQNHPLSEVRLEIRISAGCPVVAAATLSDDSGRARGAEWVVHPGAPVLPGLEVSRQAAADHRLAVDLGAIPEAVHRLDVLLALPAAGGGPSRFGAVAAPFVAVTGPDGAELASYTITGLDAESAVIAVELYRRQDAWKVRAVGQGYAGGLTELLSDLGLTQAAELATAAEEAVAEGLARSVAAPPPRTTDDARSHQASAPPRPNPAASVSSHEGSSHEGQVSGTAGPSAPQPAGPGGSGGGTPAAGPATSVPAGGTIDYRHPRRQPAPPPPPG